MPEAKVSENSSARWIFILLVLIIAIVAVLVFINNPSLINDIWLWIVGVIGAIIAFFRRITEGISALFDSDRKHESELVSEQKKKFEQEKLSLSSTINNLRNQLGSLESDTNDFDGTTITVLRYMDDGETTIGLLFLNEEFFCYTLEDTYRIIKIKGKTRIPCGTYKVNFRRELTPLTERYKETRPWFEYHLEIKDVKGFTGIYIHSGSIHEHTDGCLLVGRSLNSSDMKKLIYDSRDTFEQFYKTLKPKLDSGEYVRIKILDEDCITQKLA